MSALKQNPTLASTYSIISPSSILDFPIIGKMVGKTSWDRGPLNNQPPYIHLIVNQEGGLKSSLWPDDPRKHRGLGLYGDHHGFGLWEVPRIFVHFFVEDWSYVFFKHVFSPKMGWKILGTCIIVHQKNDSIQPDVGEKDGVPYVYMFFPKGR